MQRALRNKNEDKNYTNFVVPCIYVTNEQINGIKWSKTNIHISETKRLWVYN